jgi:hypothetical protein
VSGSPGPRSTTGARLGEKKAPGRMATDCLDGALADFAGEVAAEERYAGPCGMLSAVAKRRDQRLLSDVVEHEPPHDDIRAFLRRLPTALAARDLPLCGVTTDGSAL